MSFSVATKSLSGERKSLGPESGFLESENQFWHQKAFLPLAQKITFWYREVSFWHYKVIYRHQKSNLPAPVHFLVPENHILVPEIISWTIRKIAIKGRSHFGGARNRPKSDSNRRKTAGT